MNMGPANDERIATNAHSFFFLRKVLTCSHEQNSQFVHFFASATSSFVNICCVQFTSISSSMNNCSHKNGCTIIAIAIVYCSICFYFIRIRICAQINKCIKKEIYIFSNWAQEQQQQKI